ncbi:MAG: hypothetical protein H6782_02885 [Candidatus Nomurabacteria bacterium]|nr:MAG: hypothetical protein H6782_02885 [Candidatus Nomurabacteria bacterium]
MKINYLVLLLILAPLPALGATDSLQTFLVSFVKFLSDVVIPFLMAVAFLFFIINVIRFFVFGSTNEEGRDKAKALAVYGVFAFVMMVIFWGIINLLSSSFGLGGKNSPTPDYIEERAFNNPTCPGQTSVCEDVMGVTICKCK